MADKMMRVAGRDQFGRARALNLTPDGRLQVESFAKAELSSNKIEGKAGSVRVFLRPQESDGIELYVESGSVRVRTDGRPATDHTGEPLGEGFYKAWGVYLISVYFVEDSTITVVNRGNTQVSDNPDDPVEPPEGAKVFYNNGDEDVEWVEGYSSGEGSLSKESDHLLVFAGSESGGSVRTYVTDDNFDASQYSHIYIDWENTGDDFNANFSYFVASSAKSSNFTGYTERLERTQSFERTIDVLDISDIEDYMHVRVHARDGDSSNLQRSEIKVYAVWAV